MAPKLSSKQAAAVSAFLAYKKGAKQNAKAKMAPLKGKAKPSVIAKAKAAPTRRSSTSARSSVHSPTKRKEAPAGRSSPAASPPAKKAKTARGGRRVDSSVPMAGLKVVDDYAVKLNQTHIDANNNKFYIIQVLEGHGKFYAWNRWGRVGEPGHNKLIPCGTREQAVSEFSKKFREKTSNSFEDTDKLKPVKGKYSLVDTEDAEGGAGDEAPMGKLSEAQIKKGQKVLDQLDAAISKKRHGVLDELSSEFYTLIPHNFGRKRPLAIKTNDMLQAKIELLKFYLRMGFEKIEQDTGASPISGIMDLPLPASLLEACSGVCSKADIMASTKRGEELSKKQAGRPTTKMDASLYGSIMLYTSNAIYRQLNDALRNENRAKIKQFFKYLRLFLEAMRELPKRKRTLYRGVGVDLNSSDMYKVGKTVTWWGVSSTTSDINVANGFAKGCGGPCTLFTIESRTATDIADITWYSNEKESLLAPGTQLKVKSKTRNGVVCQIMLEEVGRALA